MDVDGCLHCLALVLHMYSEYYSSDDGEIDEDSEFSGSEDSFMGSTDDKYYYDQYSEHEGDTASTADDG